MNQNDDFYDDGANCQSEATSPAPKHLPTDIELSMSNDSVSEWRGLDRAA